MLKNIVYSYGMLFIYVHKLELYHLLTIVYLAFKIVCTVHPSKKKKFVCMTAWQTYSIRFDNDHQSFLSIYININKMI